MTTLLQEAFTLVSNELTPQAQDTLAHLMIEHLAQLPDFLAIELEEQQFEASARQAIQSDLIQHYSNDNEVLLLPPKMRQSALDICYED